MDDVMITLNLSVSQVQSLVQSIKSGWDYFAENEGAGAADCASLAAEIGALEAIQSQVPAGAEGKPVLDIGPTIDALVDVYRLAEAEDALEDEDDLEFVDEEDEEEIEDWPGTP